jgi:hypothetical protein
VIQNDSGLPKDAAELVEAAVEGTLTYYAFPEEHWPRIRTNNPLERILREIQRRTRVVGAFPDGQSALNLAAARLRHIAGTAWSTKRYLNIELLKDQQMRDAITARARAGRRSAKPKVRKILDTSKRSATMNEMISFFINFPGPFKRRIVIG